MNNRSQKVFKKATKFHFISWIPSATTWSPVSTQNLALKRIFSRICQWRHKHGAAVLPHKLWININIIIVNTGGAAQPIDRGIYVSSARFYTLVYSTMPIKFSVLFSQPTNDDHVSSIRSLVYPHAAAHPTPNLNIPHWYEFLHYIQTKVPTHSVPVLNMYRKALASHTPSLVLDDKWMWSATTDLVDEVRWGEQ